MAKSYPDELAEWVRKRESGGRDKNLVAFHAVKGDVMLAIAAGFAVKTIWANMKETGRVAFGYETFLGYVHRLLKPERAKPGMRSGDRILATSQVTNGKAVADQPAPRAGGEAPAYADDGTDDISSNAPRRIPTFSFSPKPKQR